MTGPGRGKLRHLFPAVWVASLGAFQGACGGGLPLLHPARVLPAGEVQAAAGFSGTIAAGSLGAAVRNATNEASASPGVTPTDAAFAQGALVAASVAPGLAPVVGARAGVGFQAEGGIMYTGRAIRVDARRSFDLSESWSLSVGAGGSGAIYDRGTAGALPGVDLSHLHGWGADVPVLVGYESAGELYMFWCGGRAGWEHVDIGVETSEPGSATLGASPVSLAATRFWGGGVLGGAIGFRHVHVAMELDVSYATVTGDFGGTHAQVSGVTLAPSSALWWHF